MCENTVGRMCIRLNVLCAGLLAGAALWGVAIHPRAVAFEVAAAAAGSVDGAAAERALRGFGKITRQPLPSPYTGVRFLCENPERAKVFLHKFGRDLAQSATGAAEWKTFPAGGRDVPVLVRAGGMAFLPVLKGSEVWVFTAVAASDPAAAFAAALPVVAEPDVSFFDSAYRYPVFLDKFSHYGIGSWYPSYWGDANTKGKPNTVDDHFKFAREFDLPIQPNNGGYLLKNLLPKIREYGRPWHFAQWLEWSPELAVLCPEDLVLPSNLYTTMPHYYGQVSDGGQKLMQYRNWCYQNKYVKRYCKEPDLVDWVDPNGEVGPFHEFLLWDFSENNRRNLVRFLKDKRGYTLASLGQAWYGDAAKYASWDEVKIPMTYEAFGFQPDSILAAKTWRIHPGTFEEGLAKGYTRADFADGKWPEFVLPGKELGSMFWRAGNHIWHRGSIDVPAAWLEQKRKQGPVYLNVIALTGAPSVRVSIVPDRLWINGVEVAPFDACPGALQTGQVEVTDLLRAGRNDLVFLPAKPESGLVGPLFLSDKKEGDYPYADSGRNARHIDMREYTRWCVEEEVSDTYKAIRAVDPDRFIKLHAFLAKDLSTPIENRFGAFGHNTGEGAFFRPWDRRMGYPYDIPASCEFGGGLVTMDALTRWVGWFLFEGINALDNFHNIQEMMYSPAAPAWREYMPYLKLAPRMDIRKPEIALLWSSLNKDTLPRPVPYCFDLGRGDLQAIGYSYVYMDESGLRDGKADAYPVLWDCGSWLMDEKTVERIRKYVENGGTFVALQETGRHTTTHRDAWPVSSLTGFKVKEVRPMGGTVYIPQTQPLFKALAGKSFYNYGKAIDYSNYNYADKCVVLEATAEGTQVLARYPDGSAAIGMRQLGKGRVITLGSPFWRDSYDGSGMWWPGEKQSAFLLDILDGLGLKPLAQVDSREVWRERFLSNNGAEEFLVLFNPLKEPRTVKAAWTADAPVDGLFDPKTNAPVAGQVKGKEVTLEPVTLGPLETKVIAARLQRAPEEVAAVWLNQLAKWWRPSEGGAILQRPDLPYYELDLADEMQAKLMTEAEFVALDPAALSTQENPGAGWTKGEGQSPEYLSTHPQAGRRVVFHASFLAPAGWREGDRLRLYARVFPGLAGAVGKLDVYVNGKQVLTQVDARAAGYGRLDGGAEADLAGVMKVGQPNALVMVANANGFIGELVVSRRPQVAQEQTVTGAWQVQTDADSGLVAAQLPGKLHGLYAVKDGIRLPAQWKDGRVFVAIDLDDNNKFDSFAINGKVVFHPVNWYKGVNWMDVTPWVNLDGENQLVLLTRTATRYWKPGDLEIRKIAFQLVRER